MGITSKALAHKHRTRWLIVIFASLVAAMTLSAIPAAADEVNVDKYDYIFSGNVKYNGEPLEDVTINVSGGGYDEDVQTDANGQWRVGVPEKEAYDITLIESTLPEGVIVSEEGSERVTITNEGATIGPVEVSAPAVTPAKTSKKAAAAAAAAAPAPGSRLPEARLLPAAVLPAAGTSATALTTPDVPTDTTTSPGPAPTPSAAAALSPAPGPRESPSSRWASSAVASSIIRPTSTCCCCSTRRGCRGASATTPARPRCGSFGG